MTQSNLMQTSESASVRPFANGSQYLAWATCNCYRCKKWSPDHDEPICDLELALEFAYVGSGEIPLTVAQRIGMKEAEDRYVWPCNEVDWTEEWKAEHARRYPK